MENVSFLWVLINVLKSPYVIGTAVFVIIYLSFAFYVVSYKKKPAKTVKAKKPPKAPPPPAEESSGEGEQAETPAE